MKDRYEITITEEGVELGPGWTVRDIDPCPTCKADVMAVRPFITEGGEVPLGEFVTNFEPPRVHAWGAYPCGCEIAVSEYNILITQGQPAHWIPPGREPVGKKV